LVVLAAAIETEMVKMSIKNRKYFKRAALLHPMHSPWQRIYEYGDDRDLYTCMSVTRRLFDFLHEPFAEKLRLFRHSGRGRKSALNTKQKLGLVLVYLTSMMRLPELCFTFGVTAEPASRALHEGLAALVVAMRGLGDARIKWPSEKEMAAFAAVVSEREPVLKGSFAMVDGLNMAVQEPTPRDLQNAYYNGWLHSVKVGSKFPEYPFSQSSFSVRATSL